MIILIIYIIINLLIYKYVQIEYRAYNSSEVDENAPEMSFPAPPPPMDPAMLYSAQVLDYKSHNLCVYLKKIPFILYQSITPRYYKSKI